MSTLVFSCDFDTGTLASQGWQAIGTAPILQRTYARGLGRAARVTTANQQSYYVSPDVNVTNLVVARHYLYFVTLPASTPVSLYSARIGARDVVVGFNQSTGKFSIGPDDGTKQDGTTTAVAGRWYCIDVRSNTTANPWVIDWQIDRVDQGTFSPALAAATAIAALVSIGPYTLATLDVVFKDVVASVTSSDYPIGPTRDRVLVIARAGGRRLLPAQRQITR